MTSQIDNREERRFTVRVNGSLRELIPGFLERRREDIRSLARATESRDFQTIEMIGHKMTGNGDSIGFAEISVIGAALEAAAIRESGVAVDRVLIRLESYLDRLDVEFD